jgi:hypothetical protein
MILKEPERAAAAASPDAFAAPQFLLRIGGMPIDVIEALQFDETCKWTREVEYLETLIEARRDALVEALHEAIHEQAGDQPLQRILINLKRDIFNRRVPKDVLKAGQAVAALPPTRQPQLEEWLEQMTAHSALVRHGQQVLERELESRRARLKSVLQDPGFRNGLLLASPTLESSLDNYLKASNRKLNRRSRLVERAVLLYLLRTVCKTSPFSTLGTVTTGTLEASRSLPRAAATGLIADMGKRSFVRLNVNILSRLSFFLLASEDVLKDLPVQLKDGWELQGRRVRFLRRILHINTKEGPWALDTVEESIFHLPLSPTLVRVLERLGGGRVLKLEALAGEIVLDGQDTEAGQKSREFLIHLLQLDLLTVPGLQLNLYQPDLLSRYCERLLTFGNPTATRVAEHLQHVDSLLTLYPSASHDERRQAIAAIREQVVAAYVALGASETELPRTLIYEDATVAPNQLTLGSSDWKSKLEALADIQRLLPIFDSNVNSQLVMKAYFKMIYGQGERCDDVLAFTELFSQEYNEQYQKYQRTLLRGFPVDREGNPEPTLNHFKVPEISRLDELRQAVADEVSRAYAETPPEGREVTLSTEALRAIADRIPPNIGRVLSHALFTQLAQTDAGSRLVLNKTYGGLTQMFSRFLYPLEGDDQSVLADSLRATLEQIQPPGAIFAELQGGYDSNLNLHPPVTRYEIICPGDQSVRAEHDRITLDDLYIAHDSTTDSLRLYSRRLDREIIPLYLGFLLPISLPQLRRVLINFSHYSVSMMSLWRGARGLPKAGRTMAFYPRIQYGEITLQRAMWRLPSDYVPTRGPDESDSNYFLRISKWRQQNGLPGQVFVSPDTDTSTDSDSEEIVETTPALAAEQADAQEVKAEQETRYDQLISKPMYVDFENYFSVLLLERLATRSARRLVITEMLPNHEQLWFKDSGQRYVTEFIFELHRTQGVSHE